jgi:hypothetical protein
MSQLENWIFDMLYDTTNTSREATRYEPASAKEVLKQQKLKGKISSPS